MKLNRSVNKVLLFFIIPLLFACGKKLNGTDEQAFNASREEVEKDLKKDEKIKLEKALRVIALESMRLKWEHPAKYEGKSFQTISLEMVDGKTYSGMVSFAEDILKDRNKKEILDLARKIDSLDSNKNRLIQTQKQLNLFKIKGTRLEKIEWFGEEAIQLWIAYQYIGKETLNGPVTISYQLIQKTDQEKLNDQMMTFGAEDHILEPNESLEENLIISKAKTANSKLWQIGNTPIENPKLADYGLELQVSVNELQLNGKKISFANNKLTQINAEIKASKDHLNNLKTTKGNLDELELTEELAD